MARPPATYERTRVLTTLITSTIWFLILYGTCAFSNGGKAMHMSPLEMANVASLTFLMVPYFGTHGVLMSLFKSVLAGRVIMPAAAQDASAGSGTENAWRRAAINVVLFGVVPAGIGYFLAIRTNPETMTRGVFAGRYALAGALICASVAWSVSGKPFLRTIGTPREKRGFVGTPDQYLWRYYSLPHGIANVVINFALAFALSPVPFAPGAIVPTQNVVGDTVAAFVVLTWLLTSGAKGQARNEALLGIAPPAAASNKKVWSASLTALLGGLAFAVVVGVLFFVTKAPGLGIWTWAAYRGVVFGVYAGILTKLVARAAINTALKTAEPVAAPATPAAA
jgi:hypothetical protein